MDGRCRPCLSDSFLVNRCVWERSSPPPPERPEPLPSSGRTKDSSWDSLISTGFSMSRISLSAYKKNKEARAVAPPSTERRLGFGESASTREVSLIAYHIIQ